VRHYSVSIIRDRGIDENALRFVLDHHPADSVVFIDGWTGKGVIAAELHRAVTAFNQRHGTALDPGLYAVADLCGAAAWAASSDDYLIPSSILGATVSGLVSRSILNEAVVGPDDFHGCLYYEEFAAADLSRWFIEQVDRELPPPAASGEPLTAPAVLREPLRQASRAFLDAMRRRFGIANANHIKPGLGEATRVLLRRVPDRVLVRDADDPAVAHLRLLAEEKQVPFIMDPTLPYAAAALIKEFDA
jgi:hypothetical protein